MHTTTIHQACAADGCCVVSEGTASPREVLPKLLAALAELSASAHQRAANACAAIPRDALDDGEHEWWNGSAADTVLQELFGALNEHAPDGFEFATKDGEPECFGFFRKIEVIGGRAPVDSDKRRKATKRAAAGIAAIIAVVGCTLPEPGSVRFDPEGELQTFTVDAATRIEATTGITVAVGAGERDLHVPVRLVPESSRPGQREGYYWGGHFDGEQIVVNERTLEEDRAGIVLHEMLHALTLSNDEHPAEGSVLAETGSGKPPITQGDLDWICARVACKWQRPETP